MYVLSLGRTRDFLRDPETLSQPLENMSGRSGGVPRSVSSVHELRGTETTRILQRTRFGALLGRTQPNTTARYSHLFDDPLREATEHVGKLLVSVELGRSADIVPLTKTGHHSSGKN